MDEEPAAPIDPVSADRERRSGEHFDRALKGQGQWYSRKASTYKRRAEILGLIVFVSGALIAFVPVFGGDPWVRITTGALGATIAIVEGWQRIARYGEAWRAFRMAWEKMKREQRLYVAGAGPYREAAGEAEAFLQFVEAIEAIIAEEQQIYWRDRITPAVPCGKPTESDTPQRAPASAG